WYSPQGRIIVGESVDTTNYEAAQIGAQPSLVAQMLTKMNKVYNDNGVLDNRCTMLEAAQQQMNTDIAAMNMRISQMDGQINADIAELEARITATEQECVDLDSAAGKNASDLTALANRITTDEQNVQGLSQTVAKHEQSFEDNENRILAMEGKVSDFSGILTHHTGDGIMHITEAERQNIEYLFDTYNANGLLNVSAEDAAATNELLCNVAALAADLRVAFMTGARSKQPDSYNRLKLLNSYGLCDYTVNGGSFSTDGKSLTASDALEIVKAAGGGVLHVRGDSTPEQSIWSRIFLGGDTSYYYADDEKSAVRIIVLDTCNMDSAQLNWFVNIGLDMPDNYAAIIFSHRNLASYISTTTGDSLFGAIFTAVTEGGSIDITDSFSCPDGSVIQVEALTADVAYGREIIAAIHGGDGGDSAANDLNSNFYNIGVADDMPDLDVRGKTEDYAISIRKDFTQKSDLSSIIRASSSDVTVDGSSAIKLVPLVAGAEVYIQVDNIDANTVNGYIVTQVDVKIEASSPETGRFYVATNQSNKISDHLRISDLSNGASEDGWSRVTVVTCRNPDDVNYGKSNTYINGISYSGWCEDYLGKAMDSGDIRTEVRVVASMLTLNDAIYYRRVAFYTTELLPSEDVLYNGVSDSLFAYGDKFYNTAYKPELLQQLGLDKSCYDVFCIDRLNYAIKAYRFGYGISRSFSWALPEIKFE
ncbi:MAG: hypothetical protein IJ365_08740, partial [Clostridia bacterium]|nr:hypothetical protein [Clostridia bacterium]